MNKGIVVIPAYNEEKNISEVLLGIRGVLKNEVDVIVIDDGSKDNTSKVVKELGFEVIRLASNLGYSGAILTGIKYADRKGYDFVIQFDGDGQHDPNSISKLIKSINQTKHDIVIGSRFIEKTDYDHSFFRRIGTFVFSSLIKMITGTKITDPTSGLQILNRKAYKYYVESGNYPEYPDSNILIHMLLNGFEVSEISVEMHDRISGVGMHDSKIKNIKYIITMFYSIFIAVLKGKKAMKVERG